MRTFILNLIILIGFGLVVYGIYQVSQPWACVALGSGLIMVAVINAITAEYNERKNKGN